MPYFAETDYYWAGLAFPFADGDFGFGAFLGRFGFGDSPVYTEADPENESGETFGVDEVVAGVSLAHAFIDRFSAGLTVKLINDNLATGSLGGATARTFAIDFGTNFHSELGGRPIRLGATCRTRVTRCASGTSTRGRAARTSVWTRRPRSWSRRRSRCRGCCGWG